MLQIICRVDEQNLSFESLSHAPALLMAPKQSAAVLAFGHVDPNILLSQYRDVGGY